MENEEITNKYFKDSVKGLNEIILKDKDLWYNYVIHLPARLQVVYTIVIFHQQVFNGGLHQYFFNAYGQFAYLTIDNLKLIKAFKAARILEKAVNEVNNERYNPRDFREKVFNRQLERITNFNDDLGDILNESDNEYYSLEEDLEQLLIDYLKGKEA